MVQPSCAVPRVGLGTFKAKGLDVQAAVMTALDCGIRHIDTAAIYKVLISYSGCDYGCCMPTQTGPLRYCRTRLR